MLSIIAIISSLFAAVSTNVFAADTITVDHIHDRQQIGHVIIDDDRGVAYFEVVAGRNEAVAPLPYATAYDITAALKKIYVVPLNAGGDAEPLFDQESGTGYFFASDDPWSPDGRYLAIYKINGRKVQPGVYDTKRSRFKLFDIAAGYHPAESNFTWLGENEFSIIARLGGNMLITFVERAQALSKARENGWINGEVTAEVVGAGRYAGSKKFDDLQLAKVNVKQGKAFPLLEIPRGVVSSPIRPSDRLAVNARVGALEKGWQDRRSNSFRTALSLIDLAAGRTLPVSPESRHVRLRQWSPSGERFLVRRTVKAAGKDEERGVFSIIDANAAAIVEDLPFGARNPVWMGDRLAYSMPEDASQVEESGLGASAAAYDNTIAFELTTPSPPLAASQDYVFYLKDGDLWRAGPRGDHENLTADYPHHIEALAASKFDELPQKLRFWTKSAKSSAHRRTKAIDEIPFLTEHEGRRYVLRFSVNGKLTSSTSIPFENARYYVGTSKGALFLTHRYGIGSQLHYVAAGEDTRPRLVHHFNKHLAGVSPAVGPIQLKNTGFDGQDVSSWLYLPPGASLDNAKQYPLVVIPYAGHTHPTNPSGEVGNAASIWDTSLATNTSMEMFAARGYAVLIPSIPLDKAAANRNPMRDMMPAILSAVDAAIESGFADPERLALTGHSYGGYTAFSVAVQSNRFGAIVSMAGASNLTSVYGQFIEIYKTDAALVSPPGQSKGYWAEFGQGGMGEAPWRAPERYVRNSPLLHAHNITTPLLIIHGDLDGAVPYNQAEEMFTALYRENSDAIYINYLGEEHVVEQPQNQRDMWERVFSFLKDNGVAP